MLSLALRSGSKPTSSSRLVPVTHPSDNPASGSEVKRCRFCQRSAIDTKETIHNGLLLLRVRYGLPYSELPDSGPGELSRFLSFLLLQGKERASVAFPRRQVKRGEDGLCSLQRLCRRDRWALAHGCSSIKRNLPKGCHLHTPSVRSQWERNVLSQPPPLSPGYLEHVRRVSTRVFSSGWDRNYNSFVGSHVPNPTSRACRTRADVLWKRRRGEFFTCATSEVPLPRTIAARYKEVQSSGKCRPLLIFDESIELLAPLHKLMYSHLTKQDWLLCGPPTAERIASVCINSNQTSVDLVAATDGLSHLVAETILDCAFFSSLKIPRSLRLLAKASLSPTFESVTGAQERVRHGQMMGAYLSFPLLCLQSYCAATWAARNVEDARFLVNGDDTIISADRDILVQDYPSGYRLNDDKTIRARNVAEVNSTVFLKSRGKWCEVHHLRKGGAPVDYPGMLHMAKAVSVTPGFVDAFQRARIGRRWGFLPSQLGHSTYPSYLRERGLRVRRAWTPLPEPDLVCLFPEELCRIAGRDPTPVEAEALRVVMWEHGRWGGSKRDVFSPSCGKVRRSYAYRARPCWSSLSFVGSGRPKSCLLRVKRPDHFLVPASFVSEEEERGIASAEQFRYNWDAGFIACGGGALERDG